MSGKTVDVPKKSSSMTLDQDVSNMLKEGAEILSAMRHSRVGVSTFLNEHLHRTLPAELERLKQEKAT
jgi:hypothetical protein